MVHNHYKPDDRQEMIDEIHEMINRNHEQEKEEGDPIDLLKKFLMIMKEGLEERMKKEVH